MTLQMTAYSTRKSAPSALTSGASTQAGKMGRGMRNEVSCTEVLHPSYKGQVLLSPQPWWNNPGQVQHSPYLSVHISANLKWSTHISNIRKRARSTLDFLQRNLQKCHQECRCLAYISLIRSSLGYGAAVWDPYLKQDVDHLETVQCQAA